ncbi:MAG: hypothetical protein UX78_C0010G0011 [Candidatus Amesbacteria bacterium GW2011_GWA2_47_11]|uniref:Uncharacterized protein n=2 Tax=Candidatus Amesiibacteriota TaxID=1752730 RepID=A0A0G1UDE5_9BACT|nr:MAG: hypothetical protein UX78_C0010G0011 [Candidatus Amesbacteria bacterium GW2011_GWA2_47_11]KKU92147.1 MAG: hypothetical protein UY22_C0038G0007 [Candidatus Amesbacteria bacterium GW2011_GWC1_48_10]
MERERNVDGGDGEESLEPNTGIYLALVIDIDGRPGEARNKTKFQFGFCSGYTS